MVGSGRAWQGPGGASRSIGAWGWATAPPLLHPLLVSLSFPAKHPRRTPHTTTPPQHSHPTGPEFTRPTDKQPPLHQLAVGPRSTHSLSTRGSEALPWPLSSHSHAAHTLNNWAAVPQTATLFCTSGRNVPQEGKTIPSLVPPPHALARHFHAASTFGRLS